MALTVYGDSRSGNCLKVKWTADYLRIPHVWREISVLAGETRTDAFLAINPAGQVPAARLADGRMLGQSNAILLHLAEGSSLIPADAYDRARMLEWMFWEQYSHEPYVAVARYQMAFLGKGRDEVEPRLLERGDAALSLMDRALEGRDWLAGEAISLADIALVAYTRVAHEGGFDLAPYANLRRWVSRVEQRLGLDAA